MDKTKTFSKTSKQVEAINVLAGDYRHVMLYGGGRSGKTFIILYAMVIRACKTKSRHIVLRQAFNHVKTSIWLDTLPKVLRVCFPTLEVEWNHSDHYIKFTNGSELWVGGLDDKERAEKILGKEYSTMFFNECSQIPYESITTAATRLAQKNTLKNRFYYDENPPSKKHWSYWLFIKQINPKSDSDVPRRRYTSLLMNPRDNLENIDPSYITDILEDLPEKERLRFLEGKFVDTDEGLVYYSFNRENNVIEFEIPDIPRHIGEDFNVDPGAAVIAVWDRGVLKIFDEVFLRNSDTYKVADEMIRRGYFGSTVIPDSTGKNRRTAGKSDHVILKEKGFKVIYSFNPAVKDRVNNINRLFEQKKIWVHPRCTKLIADLDRVTWKVGSNDIDKTSDPMLSHLSDALGYLAWKLNPIRRSENLKIRAY